MEINLFWNFRKIITNEMKSRASLYRLGGINLTDVWAMYRPISINRSAGNEAVIQIHDGNRSSTGP